MLRRRSGTRIEDGVFDVAGTLDGVRPGRGVVRHLLVRRVSGESADGLRALAQFSELRILELEELSGVDLAPLRGLRLTHLYLRDLEQADVAPLADIAALETLSISSLRECRIPERLTLPRSLRALAITADAPAGNAALVAQLIEAIVWPELGELRELMLRVGGLRGLPPIEVDLGFVRHLQRLQRLRIDFGIWHAGAEPSPLEPPFDGLPQTLQQVSIDAWDRDVVRERLREFLGVDAQVSVLPRSAPHGGSDEWRLLPPSDDDPSPAWSTYGSLCDLLKRRDGSEGITTEYEALERVVSELRAHDPALLKRLEFDPENAGTGVSAPTRHDLERALRCLGVTARPGGRR